MKTKSLKITVISVFILLLGISTDALGQKKDKHNGPPPWAPAHGYRAKTRHVYFPEHNFYYDTQRGVYIYLRGKNWEISAKLPSLFENVNLNVAAKVELNLNSDKPQVYNADHISKYSCDKKKHKRKSKGKKK